MRQFSRLLNANGWALLSGLITAALIIVAAAVR